MTLGRAAARIRERGDVHPIPEEVEDADRSRECTMSAGVDGSGPSIDLVYVPVRGEVKDVRVVSGDIVTYVEWVRLLVPLSEVVGHHRRLTHARKCFRPKPHVNMNEFMERLISVINRDGDGRSNSHEAPPMRLIVPQEG